MDKSDVYISWLKSFLWMALYIASAHGVTIIVELVLVDFVHGNPHRPQSNALFMMAFYPPLFGVVIMVGTFLVFALPQFLQAALIVTLGPVFGDRARFAVLFVLPLTAILTWYCYDFLTPTDFNLGVNAGSDWQPFEHGLSLSRYMKTLSYQSPVTLFSVLYFEAGLRGRSRKPLLLAALAAAIITGVVWGYGMARAQYQFL
jgi:hypothetical protein